MPFLVWWVVLGCVAATGTPAATITVTNTDDSGPNSLRDALARAVDGDTIDATGLAGTILLTSGELLVTKSVTIQGSGPDILTVDGNHASRVFDIVDAGIVNIYGLSITNGDPGNDRGGGIMNAHSTVTLYNCTVINNVAAFGGGVFNNGTRETSTQTAYKAELTVVDSTVRGNKANLGGGICNSGFAGEATLTVVRSTLSENSALYGGNGGGIYNDGYGGGLGLAGAAVTVINSTLRNNWADSRGGGAYNDASQIGIATMDIINSTISNNAAGDAGAVYHAASGGRGDLRVRHSTFSGNTRTHPESYPDSIGGIVAVLNRDSSFTIQNSILNAGASGANLSVVLTEAPGGTAPALSLGFNLSSDGADGLFNDPTDQIYTDPMLDTLRDNGGSMFTHALLCGSPAIDKGDNPDDMVTDQRGFARTYDDPAVANTPRPQGGVYDGTDIGAFEVPEACSNPCADAIHISPLGGSFAGETGGLSALAGTCGITVNSPERVYRWTPTASGRAIIDTCSAATAFDTVVYLRRDACENGAEQVCNDDGCSTGFGSRIETDVTARTTYYIVVDGYDGGSGPFTLSVRAPSACNTRTVIPPEGGRFTGTTSGDSTMEGPCGARTSTAPESVFQWTPGVSGTATIHTCDAGTDFDTVLYVVPGTDCLNLNRIGCDDNGCTRSSATSRLSFPVTAGDSYLIVVDGYGASGNFALTVTPPPTTTTTRSKCTSKELAVGAKNARAKLKCYSTGVSNGVAVESTCLAQADDKFAASYDRAIEVQDCLNGTDAVTVGDEVDTFLDDVLGSLTGGSTARSRCTAKELTAAGKKVVRTVTCHSQALRKGLPVDPGCLARAEMRYSESFARAMNRGDCLSETDATTLRSIVDSFVNELRDALVP